MHPGGDIVQVFWLGEMSMKTHLIASRLSVVCILLCCTAVTANAQISQDQDPLAAMQQVIDQQQAELNTQSEQLKSQQHTMESQQQRLESQQQRLDQQQKTLESMQSQLKALVLEKTSDSEGAAQTDESIMATPVAKVEASDSSSVKVSYGQGDEASRGFIMHDKWFDLDRFPTDIDDDKGIFILAPDGKKQLRVYGSLRARAYWDNQEQNDPWVIDMANTPASKDPNDDWSYAFNAKESRIGIDMDVKDTVALRMEFDWRGSSEKLRIRQMFLRTKHWVFGQNWTTFNTINYLPLSLDYHSTGAAVGIRTTQIKYQSAFGNWKYSVALEDNSPKVNAPDALNANDNNRVPNFGGNIDYSGDWGQARLAVLLAPNRVRSDAGHHSDFGGGVQAGFRWNINESNVLKGHALYVEGQNSMIADYTGQNLDVIYDPGKNEFRNLKSYGGQIGLEHHWRPTLSTTIGGGLTNIDEQGFQPDDAYDKGYKGLLNLIWKPKGKLDGFLMGAEYVYVNRENKDGSDNDFHRVNFVIFYDW